MDFESNTPSNQASCPLSQLIGDQNQEFESMASILICGSMEDTKQAMDHRKRRRMISNRESARRSRIRKQKHLDDLAAQAANLRSHNNEISSSVSLAAQHVVAMEADNAILKAQLGELSRRLESLDEIIAFLNANPSRPDAYGTDFSTFGADCPWNLMCASQQQPIMASADMFDYC